MKKNSRKKINPIYTSVCINCGKLIDDSSKKIINGKSYCENCSITVNTTNPNGMNAPEGILKFFGYIFSLVNPFAGFLLGLVFYSQKNNASAKNFGKNCLILMSITFTLILIFLILSVFLGTSIAGGDIFYNIKEGYY
jgi:hypothetical protein